MWWLYKSYGLIAAGARNPVVIFGLRAGLNAAGRRFDIDWRVPRV